MSNEAQQRIVMTEAEASRWFRQSRPGARIVYFRGASLANAKRETEVVRDPVSNDIEISRMRGVPRHRKTKAARHLEELCEYLRGMADVGRVALTQKRVQKPDEFGDGAVYEFRATKVW